MARRLIHIMLPEDRFDDIENCLKDLDRRNWWVSGKGDDDPDRMQINIVTSSEGGQDILDSIQSELGSETDWRIVLLPVEAVLPQDKSDEAKEKARKARTTAAREEIYDSVSASAMLNRDFIIMTVLSTLVAAIGLNEDNVAVVIGAMVIAPLLGPIIAFSLGAGLGDRSLLIGSARTALAGLAAGVVVAVLMGMVMPVNIDSSLLSVDSGIGLGTLVLALASGAAAALSIATRQSSALVGVMVAVALLPPAAAFGLLIGSGNYGMALRPASIVVINVICIVLAAQLIFLAKGIKPRTWLEQRKAENASRMNLIVWCLLLTGVAAAIIAGQIWPELFPAFKDLA